MPSRRRGDSIDRTGSGGTEYTLWKSYGQQGYIYKDAAIERNSSKVVRGGQYGHQASRVETPPARPPARRRDFFAAAGAPSTT